MESSLNREDIIRMAREAGKSESWLTGTTIWPFIERFAALVAAAERKACAKVCIDVGLVMDCVEAEREACAKVCIDVGTTRGSSDVAFDMADWCAAAIRARGSHFRGVTKMMKDEK